MKRFLYTLAFDALVTARYVSMAGGIVLALMGLLPMLTGAGSGRIEWLLVLPGVSALLTTISARHGLRVLEQRWGLVPRDPSTFIRERAFQHWKAARQQRS